MSVSSVGSATSQQVQQLTVTKPQTQTKPKDADGDHDGDTAASDSKGLDIKG